MNTPQEDSQPVPAAGRERVVRVFISSTFHDMQAERDYLVKQIFPELRRRCRERAVEFVEVDLRWGVTEAQAERGETLPICLAEIENCRPYFIALLGERYGYVPEHIDPELVKTQPWLAEHRRHSITALEILHGAINDPQMARRAYFYFRDPCYLERLAPEQRADFAAENPTAQAKLQALKGQIRQSGLSLKELYPDPETVGQWILADLWQAIDAQYPAGAEPDLLDREAAEHAAFAQSRARVYLGRSAYFERLDAQVASQDPPLVLLGESGVGKSALLANWTARYQQAHPDTLLFLHFIGATPYSADYVALLARLLGELKRRFELSEELPATPEKLREALPLWLASVAAKGRLILVLDGLNQLEDRDNAPDLGWLPAYFPPNVRVILSTLPGRALTALERRTWPTFEVRGLDPAERRQVIVEYLGQYRKGLSQARLERLAATPQSANPLYLRTLLEELRVFGVHEALDTRITHYLAAATVPALYDKVLERLEQDYERGRPGLVGEALALIGAARRGLYESELLELLSSPESPLPRAFWSPLYLALQESLVSRSGLLGFFHEYLREAVAHRYLPTESEQKSLHLRLAKYFRAQADPSEDRSWKGDSARPFVELPFHLARSNAAELLQLLFEFNWLQAKTDRALVYELLFDFDDALHILPAHHPQREALELVEGALRLSTPVITKDRTQLAAQLLGRLSHLEQSEIRQTLESAKAWREAPWLMPFDSITLPVLNKPGGRLLSSMSAHSEAINSVAISNDGSLALTGSKDRTVRVWDLRHARCLHTLEGHTDEVNVVLIASTAQGMIAITGAGRRRPFKELLQLYPYLERMDTRPSQDNTIRLWSLPGGNQLAVLEGHKSAVRCLALRGNVLFSGSDDGTIRMWDLDRVLAGAFSNCGKHSTKAGKYPRSLLSWQLPIMFIATCNPAFLRTYHNLTDSEIATGSLGVLGQHGVPVVLVAYTDTWKPSPTGHAVFSFSDYDFKAWDLITRGCSGPGTFGYHMNVVAVFSDTLLLALQSVSFDGYNYYLQIWDIPHSEDNNEHIKTITSFDEPFNCARFLKIGTQILVGGTDQLLRLIDLDSGKEVRFEGHKSEVTSVDIAESAGKIISGSSDGTLILWEIFRDSNE